MKQKLRALLFDLDGTLTDTGELHYLATIEALAKMGISISRQDYDAHIHGNNNADIVRYFFPDGDLALQSNYVQLKEQIFRDTLGEITPLPGLMELLDWARSESLHLGLVTNAPLENKDAMLQAIGLTDGFDPVILGDELPRAKPHPLPFLAALERLGLTPGQAIGFDDSVHGMTAVARAGMYGVGLTTGQSEAELKAAGANLCIADFCDNRLMEILLQRL